MGIQSIDRAARILNALAVEQDRNSGKYQPGAAACCNSYLDLNDCALARWCTPSGLPSVAMPPWAVGVMHGASVIVVHHVFRPDETLEVGAELPIHASALGKAILAGTGRAAPS